MLDILNKLAQKIPRLATFFNTKIVTSCRYLDFYDVCYDVNIYELTQLHLSIYHYAVVIFRYCVENMYLLLTFISTLPPPAV